VPAPGLVLVGIASVQVGAAFATKLFVHLGPAGTVLVRVLFAAIVLWAIWRPRPREHGPRPGTTLEALAALKPVFKPDGTVTAGNACPLNDGGAAVLVMSDEKARSLGLKPKARIIASTVAAIRPEIMGLGPIPAIQALLKATGFKIDDVDIVEINEAFAAQIVPCKEELGIPDDKLNPFGGAIALGHPFGMTGARIMTTLLNGLDAVDGRYGIESMCVAGGMGQAMLVERL